MEANGSDDFPDFKCRWVLGEPAVNFPGCSLQGTNIFPKKGTFGDDFPFRKVCMLVSWRVSISKIYMENAILNEK